MLWLAESVPCPLFVCMCHTHRRTIPNLTQSSTQNTRWTCPCATGARRGRPSSSSAPRRAWARRWSSTRPPSVRRIGLVAFGVLPLCIYTGVHASCVVPFCVLLPPPSAYTFMYTQPTITTTRRLGPLGPRAQVRAERQPAAGDAAGPRPQREAGGVHVGVHREPLVEHRRGYDPSDLRLLRRGAFSVIDCFCY
jgi:hypothetical protein